MLSQNNPAEATVVGVDIGGTHISAALVNLDSRELIPDSLKRREVDSGGDVKELISNWGRVIREVMDSQNLLSVKIGIAMPGPFDYEEGISMIKGQGKFDALYGLNVKELLASHLSIEKEGIRLVNDAACFLSGEAFSGAARECHRAIGLTLGTGFGTATYTEGEAHDAALWQHPFKNSIVEDYLSTRWFVRQYQKASGIRLKGVKELLEYTKVDVRAIDIFEEFGRNLAEFLSYFIQKNRPEVVVIGGNISHASELFMPALKRGLAASSIHIPVTKTVLGENACLIGAASCWQMERKAEM